MEGALGTCRDPCQDEDGKSASFHFLVFNTIATSITMDLHTPEGLPARLAINRILGNCKIWHSSSSYLAGLQMSLRCLWSNGSDSPAPVSLCRVPLPQGLVQAATPNNEFVLYALRRLHRPWPLCYLPRAAVIHRLSTQHCLRSRGKCIVPEWPVPSVHSVPKLTFAAQAQGASTNFSACERRAQRRENRWLTATSPSTIFHSYSHIHIRTNTEITYMAVR